MALDVKFKQGLLENLPILEDGTGATEGTIYMTTDEGGIYLGLSNGEFKRMGDFIMVDNIAALTTMATTQENISQHALYYAKAENVLCRYDGTKFEQINKQVTAQQLISLLENKATAGTANDAIVTSTIYDKNSNEVTNGTTRYTGAGAVTKVVASNTTVGGKQQAVVTIHAEDTVSTLAAAANKITLTNAQTYGSGKTDTLTLKGAGSLGPTLTADANAITVTVQAPSTKVAITPPTEDAPNKAIITNSLSDSKGNAIANTGSTYNIVGGGDNSVTVSGNTITISGKDTVSTLSAAGDKITLSNSMNGGIATTKDITLAGAGDLGPTLTSTGDKITITAQAPKLSASFNADGALNISQTVNGNALTSKTATVTPQVKYGSTGSEVAKFVNGTLTLSVPTTAEVTALLDGLNAMTFKGVKTATDVGKITTADKGDTYKLSAGGTISGVTVKVGDLVINAAADGATPEWQVVPSGDETVVTYSLVNGDNIVELKDNAGNAQGAIRASDKIVLDSGTIKHATTTQDTTVTAPAVTIPSLGGSTSTFTAFNALNVDGYGHVTGSAKSTYTVNPIKTVQMTTAVASNVTTITTTLRDASGNAVPEAATLKLGSSTLNYTQDTANNRIDIDLQWGTF